MKIRPIYSHGLNVERQLATLTIDTINAAIKNDQGAAFRQLQASTLPAMGDAYSGDTFPFRTHLGASVIGKECPREAWYGFRWATVKKFEGQLLRLFNRGHLEEGRFIAMLLMIGVQVWQQDEHGKQFRISNANGHGGGSGDGVLLGVPEYPNEYILLECKTANDKKFKELVKLGVRDAKLEHLVQSNMYMGGMGYKITLYLVVNKNTDEVYGEFIFHDPDVEAFYKQRTEKIVFSDVPPARVRQSAGWLPCKWCDHKDICHNGAPMERNCRTCKYSETLDAGKWGCSLNGALLNKHEQLAGCDQYETMNND